MLDRLLKCFLLGLVLTLGACVIYDRDHGYYQGPHYRSPGYHYWGPPIQFRFHYYRGWRGLNEENNALYPVYRVEYWDAPYMCVDPEFPVTSEG